MHETDDTLIPSIRPYQSQDRYAVIRMLADSDPWKTLGYTASHWERLFDPLPSGRDGFIIERGGNLAGMALIRPRFLFGDYLELLAIAPSMQGHGWGRELLRHVEGVVFARVKNLFLCVSDFNAGARRFYRREGYQEIGPIPNFLIPGTAEILLRKTTGPALSK
ncbi:MAG TPA: GNAT family N-acetyltransferase [Nitrospiraceae bacterium]|nr:GNAT family N-acetyltransferase [Nitrospiraceae bacterium]